MSEELKLEACPCCGGQISVHGQQTLNLWKLCRAHCASCGLTTANYATPEEAAAAMNRRAPSAPSPEFAALVAAVDMLRGDEDFHEALVSAHPSVGPCVQAVFDAAEAAERALKNTDSPNSGASNT